MPEASDELDSGPERDRDPADVVLVVLLAGHETAIVNKIVATSVAEQSTYALRSWSVTDNQRSPKIVEV